MSIFHLFALLSLFPTAFAQSSYTTSLVGSASRTMIINRHNAERAHKSTKIHPTYFEKPPALTYSKTLATTAKEGIVSIFSELVKGRYAGDNCCALGIKMHEVSLKVEYLNGQPNWTTGIMEGENIHCENNIKNALDGWAGERSEWFKWVDGKLTQNSDTAVAGHYTQMINYRIKQVGCATGIYTGQGGQCSMTLCRYDQRNVLRKDQNGNNIKPKDPAMAVIPK
jgi:Cysteine-rich secretory protein family